MKKLLTTLLAAFTAAAGIQAQVAFGHAEKINKGWRFLRVDSAWNISERPEMRERDFDDRQWRRVDLPHDWGVELPMSPDKGSCQGYLSGGVAWYRLRIPDGKLTPGRRHYIYFEGVYNHSEVYVNGQLLGKRPSGFASFLYDMTPCLREEGNTVAVRVDHGQEFDSRWYTGSGIYRNVWLVSAPEVHLAQWGTAYRLTAITKSKASVEVDVETTDDGRSKKEEGRSKKEGWNARVELIDRDGKTVASAKTAIGSNGKKTVRLTVKNPQRWKPARP